MTTSNVPSVWSVARLAAARQRSGRYVQDSVAHPGKMLPEIARQAITAYTDPGDLVVDPMCGIGTTLVEAIHLDRTAAGVELEPRWAQVAAANIDHAHTEGATGRARVVCGDARSVGRGLLDDLTGQVKLILTSPPYGPSTHGQPRKRGDHIEKRDFRYSRNPDNLAHLGQGRGNRASFSTALTEILIGCRSLLATEGRLVVTMRPYRRGGGLIDLPSQLIELAATVGLELDGRHAALLCGLRDSGLVPRANFFQIQRQRSGAIPGMLVIAHEDVVVVRHARSRK